MGPGIRTQDLRQNHNCVSHGGDYSIFIDNIYSILSGNTVPLRAGDDEGRGDASDPGRREAHYQELFGERGFAQLPTTKSEG